MKSRIRIECPDGRAQSTRIFVDGVDISDQVVSVSWSLDVNTQVAYAVITVVSPDVNVTAPEFDIDEVSI